MPASRLDPPPNHPQATVFTKDDMRLMCDAYPLDLSGKDYENLNGKNLTMRFFLAAGAGLAQRGGKSTWMVRLR